MLDSFLSQAASIVWGPWLVALLFGTHLFLTWKTGFIQKHLGTALRLSVAKDPGAPGDISQFGALMTALAATIGTGNIYGVAGAVLIGGPGAVFWMWLTGVFGIATKYSEALLAVKYRIQNSRGEMSGGPMFVLERGLNARWAGVLFALFTAVAAFGIGNMAQSNAIVEMVVVKKTVLGLTQADGSIRLWLGLAMAGLTAAVILGGIRSIARFCGFLVPFMAGFYVLGCLAILISTWDRLPAALSLIVTSAFTGHAAVGGLSGRASRRPCATASPAVFSPTNQDSAAHRLPRRPPGPATRFARPWFPGREPFGIRWWFAL